MIDVLIVDDEAAIRQTLADVLGEQGYAVTEAENGRLALKRLRASPQRLVVLLDYAMPGLDGFAVLRAIERDPALQRHAFIFLTAEDRRFPLELTDTLAQLRIPTVRKPFNLDEVLDTVARASSRLEQPTALTVNNGAAPSGEQHS